MNFLPAWSWQIRHLCIKKVADIINYCQYNKIKNKLNNYWSVSVLSNLSKDFERYLHQQISDFFDTILSKYKWGFRKRHGAQHCLIDLLEKWRVSIDWGLDINILLTDISKAFNSQTQFVYC